MEVLKGISFFGVAFMFCSFQPLSQWQVNLVQPPLVNHHLATTTDHLGALGIHGLGPVLHSVVRVVRGLQETHTVADSRLEHAAPFFFKSILLGAGRGEGVVLCSVACPNI